MKKERLVEIDERRFRLTNPDKVLWSDIGLTKADLIDYYLQVAPLMSKYLAGRHLIFTRYPDGIDGKGFYQKDCPDYAPEWIHTRAWQSHRSGRTIHFITGADAATLAWLGNQACIEIHGWLSKARRPQLPDWVVFDLDPAAPATFSQAATVARLLHELLAEVGLRSYVKTSGSLGLHVYVPVQPIYSYQQTRAFVRAVGHILKKHHPRLITLARPVKARAGKVYIDYLQNGLGKTMVMPYSPRPLAGAPVSMPLDWSELDDQTTLYGMTRVGERLPESDEAFRPVLQEQQTLPSWMNPEKVKE